MAGRSCKRPDRIAVHGTPARVIPCVATTKWCGTTKQVCDAAQACAEQRARQLVSYPSHTQCRTHNPKGGQTRREGGQKTTQRASRVSHRRGTSHRQQRMACWPGLALVAEARRHWRHHGRRRRTERRAAGREEARNEGKPARQIGDSQGAAQGCGAGWRGVQHEAAGVRPAVAGTHSTRTPLDP